MEKNKPNKIRRPLEDWTATDAEHLAVPNSMYVQQRERKEVNAEKWDTMQNAVGQQ